MNFDERKISLENLNRYRNYLRFLARVQLDAELRAKVDPSDIVQQSLLLAVQGWGDFRGTSEEELAAWLRTILARAIAHATRDWRTQKRDVERERTIEAAIDASSARLGRLLAAEQSSPSQTAMCREQEVLLAEAVESLSAEQCEAIVLRYWRGMTLNEVAEAMHKSPAATAGLLHRGLKTLRSRLSNLDAI